MKHIFTVSWRHLKLFQCLLAGHRQESLLWAFSEFHSEGPEIPRINLLTQLYEIFTELIDTSRLETGWFSGKESSFGFVVISERLPGCQTFPFTSFLGRFLNQDSPSRLQNGSIYSCLVELLRINDFTKNSIKFNSL